MACNAPQEPPAKRMKMTENEKPKKMVLKDLPHDEFSQKIHFYSDPNIVTIRVSGRDFKLPKSLACYNSSYFDRAFNGPFTEGLTKTLTLKNYKAETFSIAQQWIYHSQFVLPASPVILKQEIGGKPSSSFVAFDLDDGIKKGRIEEDRVDSKLYPKFAATESNSQTISTLLAFARLADEIGLLGPFDQVDTTIQKILISSRTSLKPEHIRVATELPAGNPTRKLLVQACVGALVINLVTAPKPNKPKFIFEKEVEEIESFAADLFKEYNKVVRMRTRTGQSSGLIYNFIDPLTGSNFQLPLQLCI